MKQYRNVGGAIPSGASLAAATALMSRRAGCTLHSLSSTPAGMLGTGGEYVVLDTNVIHQDFHLTGSAITALVDAARTYRLTLCIPEVVVQEVLTDYAEEQDKRSTAGGQFIGLFPPERRESLPPLVEPPALEVFDEGFRTRMQNLGIVALALPSDGPLALRLIRRDLDQRRPFGERGHRMRDVLLWESVLVLASDTGAPISLIARDQKAFGEKVDGVGRSGEIVKRVLHAELVADLERIHFANELLSWYASIEEYLAELRRRIQVAPEQPPSGSAASTGRSDQ